MASSSQIDPSVAALISAMAQASDQARRDHELAMAQMSQSQNAFMERLGTSLAAQFTSAADRATTGRLVDPSGIGKPSALTGRVAGDPTAFRAWRIKFRNWIVAALPEASP